MKAAAKAFVEGMAMAVAFLWGLAWLAVLALLPVALIAVLWAGLTGKAQAMTVADVPAIPPYAVEVCESHVQTVCPLVTTAAPLFVTVPNTIDNLPDLSGRIVRFDPVNGEGGAWVRLTRGGDLWFPLRALTLDGAAK